MNKKVHKLRNELTKVNRQLLLAREYSTQATVINYIDAAISHICSIGDKLEDKEEK